MQMSNFDDVLEPFGNSHTEAENGRRSLKPVGNKPCNQDVKATWRDLGYEFTQYTTLHGLRYIAQRDTFILRR